MNGNDTIQSLLASRPRARPTTEPDEERYAPETDYVAFGHGRVGRRPQMMIALRTCNGKTTAFPYSMLSEIESDDPEKGFTLTFGTRRVIVEGHHLTTLFRYLLEHRALEIVEADRTVVMKRGNECVVSNIDCTEN